jgi:hypothetical protein
LVLEMTRLLAPEPANALKSRTTNPLHFNSFILSRSQAANSKSRS